MADFIDREILMKFFIRRDHCDKEHANEHFINGIETVMEYAKNLPAADVELVKRWIPCGKALPNTRERVLATDGVFVGEMCINKRGQWERYNVTNYETLMSLDILAWMPLPEPPKMDGGADNEM